MQSDLSLSHLKLRHLSLMTHLVQYGNLHKAAQHFKVSQPAISAMLKEFEQRIGLRLFDRNNQGVVPTSAALLLAQRAQTILNEFDTFVIEVNRMAHGLSALLRVGVVPHALSDYLPKAIETYREGGGGSITIQEGTAKSLLLRLYEGTVDCVIGRLSSTSMPDPRDANELYFHLLYSERICIVEGTARKKRKLSYQDLAQREWVLTQPDSSLRQQLKDFFFRRGLVLPDPVIETTNYFQSLAMLSQSSLCSIVPQSAAQTHVKLGNVRIIDMPDDLSSMPVSFICRRSAQEDERIARFRNIFALLASASIQTKPQPSSAKPRASRSKHTSTHKIRREI